MNKYLSNKYLFISLLTISLLCIGCTDNDETGPKSVSTLPIVDDEGGIYGQPLDQEEKPLKTKDGIYIKVVVTNPQTPVYKATDANIVESTLNYFDILYVHAKETVGDTNWYNVSFSANLNTEIGWISSENCTEWNHRVGFRPKSEKAGINTIYFYSTAEEAKMALEGESIEPVGVFDILPDKKFPYHPWIILDKKTFSSSDSQEKTVAYKVLCLGKKGETLKTAAKGYTDEERADIKKSVQRVDISFVIDGTGSMSSSIKAVKTAVSKMVHTFNECQVKVLFSLTVYRDICDGKERMLEYH